MQLSFKNNNLDWLRLVFAAQVMFIHAFKHLDGNKADLINIINMVPGVPAFFFVSGFLIYASFDRTPQLKIYTQNRALRLLPGLVFVTLAAIGVIIIAHYDQANIATELPLYIKWFFAQVTILQAWNPPQFSDVGVGVLNGSLWTITVEILFYVTVPILVFCEKYVKHTAAICFALSFMLWALGREYLAIPFAGKTLFEYLSLTPLVWGWMFLTGILAYKHKEFIANNLKYFWIAIIPIICLSVADIDGSAFFHARGNDLGLVYFLSYCCLILYISFYLPTINLNFDLSYGIYIWHMVVINFLIVVDYRSVYIAVMLTFVFGLLSWFLVEKPFLRKKKASLQQ